MPLVAGNLVATVPAVTAGTPGAGAAPISGDTLVCGVEETDSLLGEVVDLFEGEDMSTVVCSTRVLVPRGWDVPRVLFSSAADYFLRVF